MADTDGVSINGKTYEFNVEDLTLAEVELLEETMDCAIEEVDFNRAAAIRTMVFIFLHRDDPEFTMDDAKQIKLSAIRPPEPEGEAPAVRKRPTKAAQGG